MPRELVLILDFGSQYTQLIARRVREQGVYSEIVPGTTPIAEIARRGPRALILSGSPASGYRTQAPTPDPAIYDLGRPLLGICYGFQVTAQALGGEVARAERASWTKVAVPYSARSALATSPPSACAVTWKP